MSAGVAALIAALQPIAAAALAGPIAVLFTAVAAMAGDVAPPADSAFWAAIAWVILLSTVGGYGLYWLNLRRGTVTRVSSLLYLTPPTTLVWGLLMFAEPIGVTTLAGLAICLAGVLLVRHGFDGKSGRRTHSQLSAAEDGRPRAIRRST